MHKGELLFSGKAKSVYQTDDDDFLILHFRNDTSAFDGKKVEQLERKGAVNNQFNAFIMKKLEAAHIPTHFEKVLSDTDCVVKRLEMIPVECVIRNIAAGSLCRRLGIEEGRALSLPVFEFFLKNDELGDPMINDSHIQSFGWARPKQVEVMKTLTQRVNNVLHPLFLEADMHLVDYKLEFGLFKGEVILGDEFSPDGCRLWDVNTNEKLDKDRFRQDMGDVVESYEEVAARLGLQLQ